MSKFSQMSFYKKFSIVEFNGESINLTEFKMWLGSEVTSTFNAIASKTIKKNYVLCLCKGDHKVSSNKLQEIPVDSVISTSHKHL